MEVRKIEIKDNVKLRASDHTGIIRTVMEYDPEFNQTTLYSPDGDAILSWVGNIMEKAKRLCKIHSN